MMDLSLLLVVLFFGLLAVTVPWTRAAVVAWLVCLLGSLALALAPWPVRALLAPIAFGWLLIVWFPGRSPIGPLTERERGCQQAVLDVSRAAREAFEHIRLAETLPALLARVEAIDPPNERWAVVQTAQILDLRADPPQVGVGEGTDRLLSWPWRDALDARIVPLRLRIDDAIRTRRLRRRGLPGFDDMPRSMRYDYYFLRPLARRLAALGGRPVTQPDRIEASRALAALGRQVRPADRELARVRDLLLDARELELELESGIRPMDPSARDRLASLTDEAARAWSDLEREDPARVAQQVGDPFHPFGG
jgi:hypothetical protein